MPLKVISAVSVLQHTVTHVIQMYFVTSVVVLCPQARHRKNTHFIVTALHCTDIVTSRKSTPTTTKVLLAMHLQSGSLKLKHGMQQSFILLLKAVFFATMT